MNCSCFHLSGDCCDSSSTSSSSGIVLGTTTVTGGAADRLVLFIGTGGTVDAGTGLLFNTAAQLVLSQGTPAAATPMLALTDAGLGLTRLAANVLSVVTAATERWQFNASGHLLAVADNTYDIGADGATRPRNIRAAGLILAGNGAVGAPSIGFDSDETSGLYRIAAGQLGWSLAGALSMSLGVVGPDADVVHGVGRWLFDSRTTDNAVLSHRDFTTTSNYALLQNASGATSVNCASGQTLTMRANGVAKLTASSTGLGFFATSPVALQTGPVLNLTNNITAGGTDGTFTNWTDLTIYANDAAAIRNAMYQQGRALKFCSDALRAYGLLT